MSIFEQLGNTDFSEVDINPVLQPDMYEFTIVGCARHVNETKGSESLALTLALNSPAQATSGRMITAGYQVRHWIGMTVSEKRDQDAILGDIKKFLLAVGEDHFDTEEDPSGNLTAFINKTITCRTGVEESTVSEETGQEYPARTKIAAFVPQS